MASVHLSVCLSVCLSVPLAYSLCLTRNSMRRGQCTFQSDSEDGRTCYIGTRLQSLLTWTTYLELLFSHCPTWSRTCDLFVVPTVQPIMWWLSTFCDRMVMAVIEVVQREQWILPQDLVLVRQWSWWYSLVVVSTLTIASKLSDRWRMLDDVWPQHAPLFSKRFSRGTNEGRRLRWNRPTSSRANRPL